MLQRGVGCANHPPRAHCYPPRTRCNAELQRGAAAGRRQVSAAAAAAPAGSGLYWCVDFSVTSSSVASAQFSAETKAAFVAAVTKVAPTGEPPLETEPGRLGRLSAEEFRRGAAAPRPSGPAPFPSLHPRPPATAPYH